MHEFTVALAMRASEWNWLTLERFDGGTEAVDCKKRSAKCELFAAQETSAEQLQCGEDSRPIKERRGR